MIYEDVILPKSGFDAKLRDFVGSWPFARQGDPKKGITSSIARRMDLRQEEEADQPMGPDPAPEVSPADPDEESAESGDSGRVVSDPREARALEANQAMGSGDEDDEENDENYEPNGELEDSESDNSAENAPKGTTYVWNIDSFSRMSAGQEKHYSDVFKCGDFSW